MLCLINTNRMVPPIAPVGIEYVAAAARAAGIRVDILDLCLAPDPSRSIFDYFARNSPRIVGLSFRNVDDCFWMGGEWFVPDLVETIGTIRKLTDAAIVIGGVGFSIFPEQLLALTGADFGIHGDGEEPIVALCRELEGDRRFHLVPGLVWREGVTIRHNFPSRRSPLPLETSRDSLDHATYFQKGGQAGVETKRGCPRRCTYCADPLAQGRTARLRPPQLVVDEIECLLLQGANVLHLCDSEFNIAPAHAIAVCDELIARGLDRHVRWYAYLAVLPFDSEMATRMRRAGCVGINFTGDSASETMLAAYRQPHRKEDMAEAIRLCRRSGIRVMIDLLLGGPGETPVTLRETTDFLKQANPDVIGAALGVRLYPGTEIVGRLETEDLLEAHPGVRRAGDGPVDLLRPTYFVSPALGDDPLGLLRDLVGHDDRFFVPEPRRASCTRAEPRAATADSSHNYNRNEPLLGAISSGARGAYWDILRRIRVGPIRGALPPPSTSEEDGP